MTDVFDEAKQLFKNKNWTAARDVLLKILTHNDQEIDQIIFEKLADIHLKLHESIHSDHNATPQHSLQYLLDAGMYYNKARNAFNMNKTKTRKPTFYIKYGNLLQYHLKQYNTAESMYLEYINIDKYNHVVYFHYANVLQSMKCYEKAKRYYLQCLEFQESQKKSSVHFRLAMLYYYKLSQHKNGLHHITKCIQLDSNTTKYHYEYALMLKNENDTKYYPKINECFEIALKLSNHGDPLIITKYATFLIKCKRDKQKGAEFMKLASILSNDHHKNTFDATEQKEQKDEINELNETLSNVMLNISNNKDNYQYVKCIIYDFDSAITCWNISEFINDIAHLYTVDDESFVKLFGWRDRIRRLSKHFESIISKDIKIILLSAHHNINKYKEIVIEALNKAYLNHYFHQVHVIHKNNEADNKLHFIKELKKKYDYTEYNALLYIDGHRGAIEKMREHCFSIFVPEHKGLTLSDFENIERNMGIETTNYASLQCEMPPSLLSINANIYYEIKRQIVRARYDGCIDKLDVIQWIQQNWSTYTYKDAFIEFASKYSLICRFSSQFDMWTADQITNVLLELEPLNSDLNTRKGTFLHSLGYAQEAEKCWKKATSGRYITAFVGYGYFLMKEQREYEGIGIFEKALKISPLSIKALIGIGRCMLRLGDINNMNNAEYFFKKAVSVDSQFDTARYRYGTYLYEVGRYQEAHKQLSKAIELWPHSDMNHYMLALCYRDLNDMDAFRYHLEECLNLNPENHHAKQRYYKHFNVHYITHKTEEIKRRYLLNGRKWKPKQKLPLLGTEKEFEIFWFDKLEMWSYDLYDDSFAVYYRYFVEKKMNTLESLFSMFSIKLKEIGITNEEHVEIIMNAIDEHIILEHEKFKQWLSNIVGDIGLSSGICDILRNYEQPIYSFHSFYRNVASKGKLKSILGGQYINLVMCIWGSYFDEFLNQ